MENQEDKHANIDLNKFAKDVKLKIDGIAGIKLGDRKDITTNRTIIPFKTKKNKQVKRVFYNQATLLMIPKSKQKLYNPSMPHQKLYMNIKLFNNGSVQITGCKSINDCYDVLTTLVTILKKGDDFLDANSKSTIQISNIKIDMINSGFNLDYKIDREKLLHILKTNHNTTRDKYIGQVECKYNPLHACVNIKYNYPTDDGLQKKISIFVFQTGSILITGARNLQHIIGAYEYINRILNYYKPQVQIIHLDPTEIDEEYKKFMKSTKKAIINC